MEKGKNQSKRDRQIMQGDHNHFDQYQKPLKAVIVSNKRNPGKPQLLHCEHLFYKLPAEHTTKSLTPQWISESSINLWTVVVVYEWTATGSA